MKFLGNQISYEFVDHYLIKWDYKETTDPATTTNPAHLFAVWMNLTSGEKFTCIDNTVGANVWEGNQGTRVPFPYAGLTLLHDSFSGSGNIIGLAPDTVNLNSDTWSEVAWQSSSPNVDLNGTYAAYNGTGSIEAAYIDCGYDDYTIEATYIVASVSAVADIGVLFRINDTTDNGEPTDYIRANIENDTNTLVIGESVSGSFNSLGSGSVNPPEGSSYVLKVVVSGSSIDAYVDDVLIASGVAATHLTGGNVGFIVRGNTAPSANCHDFKVTY